MDMMANTLTKSNTLVRILKKRFIMMTITQTKLKARFYWRSALISISSRRPLLETQQISLKWLGMLEGLLAHSPYFSQLLPHFSQRSTLRLVSLKISISGLFLRSKGVVKKLKLSINWRTCLELSDFHHISCFWTLLFLFLLD